MKFKENFKRFMTLNRHSDAGFTLVELIVVIAILAILAGVAVPVYSGYIAKAEKAADLTLLGAVNDAFAAACMSEGTEVYQVSAANLAWENNCVTGVSAFSGPKGVDAGKVDTAFRMFYSGNETAAFKVLAEKLFFVPGIGFVSQDDYKGTFTYAYGGGALTLNSSDIEALKGTTFFSSMGVDGMLNKVSDVSGFAALLGSDSAMQKVYDSEAFIEHAASALGVDTSKEGWEDEVAVKINAMCKELEDKEGITYDAAYKKIQANAAVIHAAKNATEMENEDIFALLSGSNATQAIQDKLSTDPSAALSEAALAYGMYTAYAHSTGNADLIAKTEDPLYILKNLNDPGFKAYLEKDQAKTDLDGYKSALSIINDTSKDTNAVSSVLVNGFNDQKLVDALTGIFGN